MSDDKKKSDETSSGLKRRSFLKGVGIATASAALPRIWIPNDAYAQTEARGSVKHLIYIRLSGGFRFTAAFNGGVAERFNPWGRPATTADGTEWTPSDLLSGASWLEGEEGTARSQLGMRPVTQITNDMALLPCVDHEPTVTTRCPTQGRQPGQQPGRFAQGAQLAEQGAARGRA